MTDGGCPGLRCADLRRQPIHHVYYGFDRKPDQVQLDDDIRVDAEIPSQEATLRVLAADGESLKSDGRRTIMCNRQYRSGGGTSSTSRLRSEEETTMLMRTDPFREIDRLTQEMWGPHSRLAMMPMTAYHDEGTFVVHLDIPGVKPETIDVTVDRNVLSVRAERTETGPQTGERLIEERSYGTFTRQLVLDDALDVDHLTADYDAGVLTLRIPIAEQAKPRRVEIKSGQDMHELSA